MLNLRKIAWASLIPLLVMLVALIWRPVWRDDVWALFMSEPSLGVGGVLDRSSTNVHPPFYFYILHFWRSLFDGVIASKLLNLVFIIIGAMAAWRLGKTDRRETAFFLLFCAGSYWLIYFAAEIRPYTLMFSSGVVSVLAVSRILKSKAGEPIWPWVLIWTGLSAAACLTHYFSFVWTAALGLLTGLSLLSRGRGRGFILVGVGSVLAVIPGLLFLAYASTRMGIPPAPEMSAIETLTYGLNQFTRGLLTKLFGSNLALAALFFMSIAALIRRRDPVDRVFGGAVLLTVLAVFTVHMSWQPVIKERSFMIIMPALIYLMTRAAMMEGDGQWRARFKTTMPYVIALSPILFILAGEYFKDREKMADVRAQLSVPECYGASVLAYFRPAPEGEGYNEYYTRLSLKGLDIKLIDAASGQFAPQSFCPVKALALQLPRGEKDAHVMARAALTQAGAPLSQLSEISIGKGRNLLYVQADE